MASRTATSFSLSLILAVILSGLYLAGFLSEANTGLTDNLYFQKKPLGNIVVVGIDDKSLQEIGRWPWSRDVHAQLIERAKDARVIGVDVSFFEASSADTELASAISAYQNVVLVSEYIRFETENGKIYGAELLKPIFAAKTGFANIFTDADGIARTFPTRIESRGVVSLEAFSVAVAEAYTGNNITLIREKETINFFAKPGGFTTVSFTDVISNRTDTNFTNTIVLVGATAASLRDTQITPISATPMAGVEIHANIVQMILTNQFLSRHSDSGVVITLFILAILVTFLFYRTRIIIATAGVIALAIAYMFVAVLQFDSGTIMNIAYPVLTLLLTYVANIALFYTQEKKEKALVTSIFGKYVSKEVANEILRKSGQKEVEMGGEKRDMTIMFSDIRNFTSTSEKMEPEELVDFLNKYLASMTEVIVENRGVIDKYIGDAIMAFWNAPLEEKEHAKLAVRAAMGMISKAKELGVGVGISINTGPAVVGSIGSSHRVDYTVIGDTVNTASRLEGLNKEYGTSIMIGEKTHEQINDEFFTREIDMIRVKGKEKSIRIYEIIAKIGEETEEDKKLTHHFGRGLALYRRKQWKEAEKAFRSALKLRGDKASETFIERCRYLKKHPPDKWRGVWTMKTK